MTITNLFKYFIPDNIEFYPADVVRLIIFKVLRGNDWIFIAESSDRRLKFRNEFSSLEQLANGMFSIQDPKKIDFNKFNQWKFLNLKTVEIEIDKFPIFELIFDIDTKRILFTNNDKFSRKCLFLPLSVEEISKLYVNLKS